MNLFEKNIRIEESYRDESGEEPYSARMSPLGLLQHLFWQGGQLLPVEGKAGAAYFAADTGNFGIFDDLHIEMPEELLPQFLDLYERLRKSEWTSQFAIRRENRFCI